MPKTNTERVKKHRLLKKEYARISQRITSSVSNHGDNYSTGEELKQSVQEQIELDHTVHNHACYEEFHDTFNDYNINNDSQESSDDEFSNAHDEDDLNINISDISFEPSSSDDDEEGEDCEEDEEDEEDAEDEECEQGEEDDEPPEIAALKKWSVQARLPNNHLDSLLAILRQRLLPQLPKSHKTFLGSTNAKYKIEAMKSHDGTDEEFVYLTVAKGLTTYINPNLHNDRMIKLDFNIDGVKINKSTSRSLWPILCKVRHPPDIYKPFPVAVFDGNSKPESLDDYLRPFITEINDLLLNGVNIGNIHFNVFIDLRFICDAPVRAFLKNIKGHTCFVGCERCTVIGRRVDTGYATDTQTISKSVRVADKPQISLSQSRNINKITGHTGSSTISKNVKTHMTSELLNKHNKNDSFTGHNNKSAFEIEVLSYLKSIQKTLLDVKAEVMKNQEEISAIKIILQQSQGNSTVDTVTKGQLMERYPYKIPIQTMEDFEKFDGELATNQKFKADVNTLLLSGVDTTLIISKCMVSMLKLFLHKRVASKFTAVKQTNNKKVMNTTNFYQLIEGTIKSRRKLSNLSISDGEFTSALSKVLTNVSGWSEESELNELEQNFIKNL
uniref:Uncharacterized protein n=1 Tax=Trichogramma kaykai TaxID=54128 RepID=A0ABD2W3X0_9HYME